MERWSGKSTEWVMTGSALESFYHVFYLTSSAEKEIICKIRFSFASSTLNLLFSSLRLTHHHRHVYYIDFDIIVQTYFRRRWCAFLHLHFPFKRFFLLKHFVRKKQIDGVSLYFWMYVLEQTFSIVRNFLPACNWNKNKSFNAIFDANAKCKKEFKIWETLSKVRVGTDEKFAYRTSKL